MPDKVIPSAVDRRRANHCVTVAAIGMKPPRLDPSPTTASAA
jgi:hypothetical protein